MSCPSCGEEGIRATLSPRGMLRQCVSCATVIPDEPVAQAAPVAPVARPLVKAEARAKTVARPIGASGTIRAAKAEAKTLRASIRLHERALKHDRTELAKLDRLLDAAEARPRAVVRPIRTTAPRPN